jgi:hypothetical protein
MAKPAPTPAPDVAGLAGIDARLRELVTEVRSLRADLARTRRRPSRRRQLLPVIADAVQHRVFSAKELFEHADIDAALAAAFDAASIQSVRQLGKALHAIGGRAMHGLRLDRVGDDRDGAVWRVFPV